jgi:hypothetical protein
MKIVIGVAMIVAVLVIGCCLAMQVAYMREVILDRHSVYHRARAP